MIGLGVYKNYKAICEVMGWTVKSGKSKQLQLKDFERYCKYHKEGQKFIIDEVYEEPKEKIDNRANNGGHNTSKFPQVQKLVANMLNDYDDKVIMTTSDILWESGLVSNDYKDLQYNKNNISRNFKIDINIVEEVFGNINTYFKGYIRTALSNINGIEYNYDYVILNLSNEVRRANKRELKIINNIVSKTLADLKCKSFNEVIFKKLYEKYRDIEQKYLIKSELSDDIFFYKAFIITKTNDYVEENLSIEEVEELKKSFKEQIKDKFMIKANNIHESALKLTYVNKNIDSLHKMSEYLEQNSQLLDLLLYKNDKNIINKITRMNNKLKPFSAIESKKNIERTLKGLLKDDNDISNVISDNLLPF